MNVAELVDVERYPLLDPGGDALRERVRELRAALASGGAAEAPGFLSAEGLRRCISDAQALAPLQYKSVGAGTAYLEEPSPHWARTHPRAIRNRYSVGVVAYDQFPAGSPIRALYEWQPLIDFVGAVLRRQPLFRYADPLGALNLAVMGSGDELQWHYDQTDFVVSLALCSAVQGGDFEVVPKLRDRDENYPEVARVLDGASERVVRLPMTPGTLLIFAGRTSLHRVSPIAGATDRLVALFGYDTSADTRSTPHLQLKRYGRTA